MPNDKLDELIDAGLRRYSAAEPLGGIEARVLRRVHASGQARSRTWALRFALAVPALAALVLAAVVVRTWQPAAEPPLPAAPAVAAVKQPRAIEPAAERVTRPARRRDASHRVLPKREQFPTPAPMTAQERALVAWTAQAPADASQAFTELRARADLPVVIPPLQIEPLQRDDIQ